MNKTFSAISKGDLKKYDLYECIITTRKSNIKAKGIILVSLNGEIDFVTTEKSENEKLRDDLYTGEYILNYKIYPEYTHSYCIYSYDEEDDIVDNREIKQIKILKNAKREC